MNGYDRMRLASHLDGIGGRIELRISRKTHLIPVLVVINRSHDVMAKLASYGGSPRPDEEETSGAKLTWRCTGDEATVLLKAVRPLLLDTVKQQQADLLLNLTISPEGARLIEDNPTVAEDMRKLTPWNPNSVPAAASRPDPLLTQ
jgi:hypothetical protein